MKKIVKENMLTNDDLNMSQNTSSVTTETKSTQSLPAFTMNNMDEYDTGDILLFSNKTFIPSRMIEYLSGSIYSHVGIILKDPTYIKPELTGLYILESTGLTDVRDSEDNVFKTGVQIRCLVDVCKEYDGAIFWRKLQCDRNEPFYQTIANIHAEVYNKPYDFDLKDWLEGLLNIQLTDMHRTSKFFCSAMVTYIYYRLGFVDDNTPWTIIRPKDLGTEFSTSPTRFFANDVSRINIINCILDNEIMVSSYDMYLHYVYRTY